MAVSSMEPDIVQTENKPLEARSSFQTQPTNGTATTSPRKHCRGGGRTFKENSRWRDCASRPAQTLALINTLSRLHSALIRSFGVSNMLLVRDFRPIAVYADHSNSRRLAIILRPLPAMPCFIRCPDMVDRCEQARPYRCVPILMNVARIVRVNIFSVTIEEMLDLGHVVLRE